MTIKGVKIILTAYKYVYYFIAYPVHEAPDYEEPSSRHLDTLGELESDDKPFSVHEPSAIWALWASAPANPKYESLQLERKRVEESSKAWKCETRASTSSCTFNEGVHKSGRVLATIAAVSLRSSRPASPALLARKQGRHNVAARNSRHAARDACDMADSESDVRTFQ